jgi:hypothetical protein
MSEPVQWPAAVAFVPVAPFSMQPLDNALRTQFDAGPVQSRPRFTAVPVDLSFRLKAMSRADFAVFEEWFCRDLKGGPVIFEAKHPMSGQDRRFRFQQPYRASWDGPKVKVDVSLQVLP